MNITIDRPQAAGFLSVESSVATSSTTSTVNFPASQVIAHGLVAPIPGFLVNRSGGSTNLVIQMSGYFRN